MFFNDDGKFGQFHYVIVCNRKMAALFFRHFNRLDRRLRIRTGIENHFDQLGTDRTTDDRHFAFFQHRFVYVEFIRIDGTLHNGFTQPVAGRNENDIREAGFRIQREHDAGRRKIGTHHFLDTGRQSHFSMFETALLAIGNRRSL